MNLNQRGKNKIGWKCLAADESSDSLPSAIFSHVLIINVQVACMTETVKREAVTLNVNDKLGASNNNANTIW